MLNNLGGYLSNKAIELYRSATREKKIHGFELVSLWTISASFIAVLLLALGSFRSSRTLILGFLVTSAIVALFNFSVKFEKFNFPLFIILLMALFFRSDPYLWIMGGQDQGIYVNMSSAFERNGSAFFKDKVRESINEEEKAQYDSDNQHSKFIVRPGKGEGFHQPGVYINNLSKSEYVFQFYHLHPLWMALFAKMFGSDNRVYSLVFFSLFSIISFYLLAIELSQGRKPAAYLIALLLALNPLHAFFSKFPVSEMLSLAFSSAGFYFLVKYYRDSEQGKGMFFHLILSAGFFCCLFFNHISGFMYLPFFYVLLLVAIVFLNNSLLQRSLSFYFIAIFFCFSLSVLYGIHYSAPYFYHVFDNSFGAYIGMQWAKVLSFISVLLLMFILYVAVSRKQLAKKLEIVVPYIHRYYSYLIFGLILLALYRAYQLGFTTKWVDDTYIGKLYDIANHGLASLYSSSIVVAILFISPLGFIFFVYAVNDIRSRMDVVLTSFVFYLSIPFIMRLILDPVILYQYYYARYLLSEIVPYALLLVSLYLGQLLKNLKYRTITIVTVVLMVLYFIYFSFWQLKATEAAGVASTVQRIERNMDKNDIIVIDGGHLTRVFGTPLSYYYGRNTITYNDKERINWTHLFSKYDDVLFITQRELPYDYFKLIDKFPYEEGYFEHVNRIPKHFTFQKNMNVFLYKIDGDIAVEGNISSKPVLMITSFDRSNFYKDVHNWTNGDGIISNIHYPIKKNDRHLVLVTRGYNPWSLDLDKLKLNVLVNGRALRLLNHNGKEYYYQLDYHLKQIDEIRIQSRTFIPSELGMGGDTRSLGVDIDSIKITN